MATTVSIVIPVLADDLALSRVLQALPPMPDVEVVVVDGAHTQTLAQLVAHRPDVRLLHAPAGRGRQLNAGADVADGRWLWFLHADCLPPPDWLHEILSCDSDPSLVGGWFRLTLDATAWQARVIERLTSWRVRLFGLAYGDQGIFVRRDIYAQLDGYPDWPLMEDVEFVRRLQHAGRVHRSTRSITTSARRWRREGWFRRSTWNMCLLALYFAGVSPERLAVLYERVPGFARSEPRR